MNFKLKGRTLLNADIISPDIPYAEFSPDVSIKYVRDIAITLNAGHNFLMFYKLHRNDMHIQNIVEMLEKMEKEYQEYSHIMFDNSRRGES